MLRATAETAHYRDRADRRNVDTEYIQRALKSSRGAAPEQAVHARDFSVAAARAAGLQRDLTKSMRLAVLPYQQDPTSRFRTLRDLPYPAMLDSAGGNGRFDILCADPIGRAMAVGPQAWIERADGSREAQPSPWEALRRLLAGHRGSAIEGPWPFAGGLLGVLGYELGDARARPAEPHGLPDMVVGLYGWALLYDHRARRCALLEAIDRGDAYWRTLLDRLDAPPAAQDRGFRLTRPFSSNLDRSAYGQAFRRVIDYIHAGDCYQVNLAQRLEGGFDGDPLAAYVHLRRAQRSHYSAYLEGPDWAVLSLSPEAFLHTEGRRVSSSPIKGTRPRGSDAETDAAQREALAASAKDRAENLMIVDLVRNDLGRVCEHGSVRVDRLWDVETYPNVHHLVSTVSGSLAADRDVFDLLAAAFPGGSITGAPKRRAMEIIRELEPHRRQVYCGSIGYVGLNGRADWNIAIRTLLCEGERIHCWAGGGLVADSEEDAEYRECQDKIGRILDTLSALD